MSVQRFTTTTEINRPAPEVFRWHERAGALERLTPPWEKIEILSSSGGITEGQRVALRQKFGPFWLNWEVEHRGYIEGKQFRDVALRGPFAQWDHLHRVIAGVPSACKLEDTITYRLPMGFLGELLVGGRVRGQLAQLFSFRHERTVEDLNAAAQYGAVRPMQFLVSGASGLVGKALIPFLRSQGHEVIRLVRHAASAPDEVTWDPEKGTLDLHRFKGLDAVIHLAGASVGRRWSPAVRDEIWKSRILGTRLLVEALGKLRHRPFVFLSASATGIYGHRGDEELDERSERGSGFLADVCDAWEREAEAVEALGIRPVMMRTGMVLTPAGGALGKLLPFFRKGLGGRLGSGEQWISWISIDDLVGAYYHAVLDQRCVHEVNAVAPAAVTNREFTEVLAEVLHRPALLPVPGPILRGALGQMAEDVLLASTRVVPGVLEYSGYRFRHPELKTALGFLLGRPSSALSGRGPTASA